MQPGRPPGSCPQHHSAYTHTCLQTCHTPYFHRHQLSLLRFLMNHGSSVKCNRKKIARAIKTLNFCRQRVEEPQPMCWLPMSLSSCLITTLRTLVHVFMGRDLYGIQSRPHCVFALPHSSRLRMCFARYLYSQNCVEWSIAHTVVIEGLPPPAVGGQRGRNSSTSLSEAQESHRYAKRTVTVIALVRYGCGTRLCRASCFSPCYRTSACEFLTNTDCLPVVSTCAQTMRRCGLSPGLWCALLRWDV